ncbi:pyridoxal phosphate-dependent aminotransferase [Larsenimonas salina]|uniref:pyridoxal phosphate-dependent aminotransferase n=1 Tax=Larsenimonas salina TaxID=1295565 RepID=UPI00207386DA|nr:aminotransferase class I/II-fold pyridoxal phosphate-dependent enzyme [Larsenimonas salina]
MSRFAPQLDDEHPKNPFPGLKALERRLGRTLPHQLGSNEGLDMPHNALAAVLGERAAHLARAYGDAEAFEVRTRLAGRLDVALETLMVDAGADSLMALTLRACCAPGDTVVTSAGTYPTFAYFARGHGCALEEVPYGLEGGALMPDIDALCARANASNARLVYLANPDNPTGALIEVERIEELARRLPEQCWLLLDEAYFDFCAERIESRPLPGVIRLRTFSKAHGLAGLRIGYALAEPETVRALNAVRIHYAVSSLALDAATTLLDHDEEVQTHIQDVIARRERLSANLRAHGVSVLPSVTNFVTIVTDDAETATDGQHALLEAGVIVHRPPHPALGHLLRISAVEDALMPGRLDPLLDILAKRDATKG